MGDPSPDDYRLQTWFDTPPGRYLLAWEQARFDQAVADLFGYHALQLGLPALDALRANRMPNRWLALDSAEAADAARPAALLTDFAALPFSAASLDLVALPHVLEMHADPHAALREVERVLVPEGRVLVCGMNPLSLWGLREYRGRLYRRLGWGSPYLPPAHEYIHPWRLRDWLRLLGFEVELTRFGCYRPAVRSEQWLERQRWLDPLGERWWPFLGAAYFVVAVKRVRGMRLLGPAWKNTKSARASVPLARRSGDNHARAGHDRVAG